MIVDSNQKESVIYVKWRSQRITERVIFVKPEITDDVMRRLAAVKEKSEADDADILEKRQKIRGYSYTDVFKNELAEDEYTVEDRVFDT